MVEGLISGIQILGILFGLFMLYLTFLYQKRHEFSIQESLLWSTMWLGFILVSILPNALQFFVKGVLHMARPLDFLIIVGFMFLIGISFYNFRLLKKMEARVELMVRKIALKGE